MSLAPSVVLVVPTGEAYGHAEMLEMLMAHYAEELPGVAWRSFVERAELPCSTGHGREGA